MTLVERERATTSLQESRDRLLRTTRGLSPAQLHYKPASDRWSVAECLEHIIVVETLVLSSLEKALEAADSPKSVAEDDALVQRVLARAERLKGPNRVMPVGRWPHDQLLREFEAARTRTSEFAATTNADLRRHGFPHPMFGPLDCYQWLLVIAAHGERHRAQAEEVMADAGFPRFAGAV